MWETVLTCILAAFIIIFAFFPLRWQMKWDSIQVEHKSERLDPTEFNHKIHLNTEWKIPSLNSYNSICKRSWQVWLRDERLVSFFKATVSNKKKNNNA